MTTLSWFFMESGGFKNHQARSDFPCLSMNMECGVESQNHRMFKLEDSESSSSPSLYFTESKASLPVGHYLVTSATLSSHIPWVPSRPRSEIRCAPREMHSSRIKQNNSCPTTYSTSRQEHKYAVLRVPQQSAMLWFTK